MSDKKKKKDKQLKKNMLVVGGTNTGKTFNPLPLNHFLQEPYDCEEQEDIVETSIDMKVTKLPKNKKKKLSKKEVFELDRKEILDKFDELTEIINAQSETIAKQGRRIETLEFLLKSQEGRADNIEKRVGNAEKKLEKIESNTSSTVQKTNKEVSELKTSFKSLSETITEQNKKVDDTLLSLNKAITSLK